MYQRFISLRFSCFSKENQLLMQSANSKLFIIFISQQVKKILFFQLSVSLQKNMFNCLRRIVAGQKNRTIQGDYDLDLTYITDNLIAMAFPASGLQKTIRNCIEDVANYLNQKHNSNYYIFNVSNRTYESGLFGGRVKEYDWQNHQAPCLTTLFQIIQDANNILSSNKQSVVVVHCNHGKGRTGTALMCILMFNKKCQNVEETLKFYNSKRFSSQNYKVQQPCQIRYLNFFKQIIDQPWKFKALKSYRLIKILNEGLNDHYYLKISQVRNKRVIFDHLQINENQIIPNELMIADIFIEIKYRGVLCQSRAARINFHLSFLNKKDQKENVSFDSSTLSLGLCHNSNYTINLQFQEYCKCHISQDIKCSCQNQRTQELKYWAKMHQYLRKNSSIMNQNEISLQIAQSQHTFKK